MNVKHTLPDITSNQRSESALTLQWVGMEDITIPLAIAAATATDKGFQIVTAKANIFVSLDNPQAKGIHMSRLYTLLNRITNKECTKEAVDEVLALAVASQEGLSSNAQLSLEFDLPIRKPSLLSGEAGYQAYRCKLIGQLDQNKRRYQVHVTLPYSSTCPCSASLARQAYAEVIDETFVGETISKSDLLKWVQSEQGSIATPHSQRSYAYIQLDIGDNDWPSWPSLIQQLEAVIGTPVQAAVKRSDEQEFARLNARNLMFCEDAARRIKGCLNEMAFVNEYQIKVEHQESLHAHNAVVIDRKF